MKKALMIAAVGAVAVSLFRRFVVGSGGIGGLIQRMPQSAPPRWMFDNISAIRDTTERILARLEESHPSTGPVATPAGLGC